MLCPVPGTQLRMKDGVTRPVGGFLRAAQSDYPHRIYSTDSR